MFDLGIFLFGLEERGKFRKGLVQGKPLLGVWVFESTEPPSTWTGTQVLSCMGDDKPTNWVGSLTVRGRLGVKGNLQALLEPS